MPERSMCEAPTGRYRLLSIVVDSGSEEPLTIVLRDVRGSVIVARCIAPWERRVWLGGDLGRAFSCVIRCGRHAQAYHLSSDDFTVGQARLPMPFPGIASDVASLTITDYVAVEPDALAEAPPPGHRRR